MKKFALVLLIGIGLIMGITTQSFASDWDKAGKILTIIEGVRVVTGGKVDLIGTITGINNPRESRERHEYYREYNYPQGYAYRDNRHRSYVEQRNFRYAKRVWVPHLVWRERYVPEHTEYRPGYGEVVVQAHYERYLVEEGGHWETVYD